MALRPAQPDFADIVGGMLNQTFTNEVPRNSVEAITDQVAQALMAWPEYNPEIWYNADHNVLFVSPGDWETDDGSGTYPDWDTVEQLLIGITGVDTVMVEPESGPGETDAPGEWVKLEWKKRGAFPDVDPTRNFRSDVDKSAPEGPHGATDWWPGGAGLSRAESVGEAVNWHAHPVHGWILPAGKFYKATDHAIFYIKHGQDPQVEDWWGSDASTRRKSIEAAKDKGWIRVGPGMIDYNGPMSSEGLSTLQQMIGEHTKEFADETWEFHNRDHWGQLTTDQVLQLKDPAQLDMIAKSQQEEPTPEPDAKSFAGSLWKDRALRGESLSEEAATSGYSDLQDALADFYRGEYFYSRIKQGGWIGEQSKEQAQEEYADLLRKSGAVVANYLAPVYDNWIKMHDWDNIGVWSEVRVDDFWQHFGDFTSTVGGLIYAADRWSYSIMRGGSDSFWSRLVLDRYPSLRTAMERMRREDEAGWDKSEGDYPYADVHEFWDNYQGMFNSEDHAENLEFYMSMRGQIQFTEEMWKNYVGPIFIDRFEDTVPDTLVRVKATAERVAEVAARANRLPPEEVSTRVNLGLNEAHSSGPMMDYIEDQYGVSKQDLDNMSNQDVDQWDAKLRNMGVTEPGMEWQADARQRMLKNLQLGGPREQQTPSFADIVESMAEAVPAGPGDKFISRIGDKVLNSLDEFALNNFALSMAEGNEYYQTQGKSNDVNGQPFTYRFSVRFLSAGNLPNAAFGSAAWGAKDEQGGYDTDGRVRLDVYANPRQWRQVARQEEERDKIRRMVAATLDHEFGHLQRIIATGKAGFDRNVPPAYLYAGRGRSVARDPKNPKTVDYGRTPTEMDAQFSTLVNAWNRLDDTEKGAVTTVAELVRYLYGPDHPKTRRMLRNLGSRSEKWRNKTLSRFNREGVPLRSWGGGTETFESLRFADVVEKFATSAKTDHGYAEVFMNPSPKELRVVRPGARAWVMPGGNVYAWDYNTALHMEIANLLVKEGWETEVLDGGVAVYLHPDVVAKRIMVELAPETYMSKRWNKTAEVIDAVETNPYIMKMFPAGADVQKIAGVQFSSTTDPDEEDDWDLDDDPTIWDESMEEANLTKEQWAKWAEELGSDVDELKAWYARMDPSGERNKYASWIRKIHMTNFSGLPPDLLNYAKSQEASFPSAEEGRKEYVRVIDKYIKDLLMGFQKLKIQKKVKGPEAEIMNYDIPDLIELVGSEHVDDPAAQLEHYGGEVVYRDARWIIVSIPEPEAAETCGGVGHGAKEAPWCTRFKGNFETYNNGAGLYFIYSPKGSRVRPYKKSHVPGLEYTAAIGVHPNDEIEFQDASNAPVTEDWVSNNNADALLAELRRIYGDGPIDDYFARYEPELDEAEAIAEAWGAWASSDFNSALDSMGDDIEDGDLWADKNPEMVASALETINYLVEDADDEELEQLFNEALEAWSTYDIGADAAYWEFDLEWNPGQERRVWEARIDVTSVADWLRKSGPEFIVYSGDPQKLAMLQKQTAEQSMLMPLGAEVGSPWEANGRYVDFLDPDTGQWKRGQGAEPNQWTDTQGLVLDMEAREYKWVPRANIRQAWYTTGGQHVTYGPPAAGVGAFESLVATMEKMLCG